MRDYRHYRPNIERTVAQVATQGGWRIKLRYRGTNKNHAWLKRRTPGLQTGGTAKCLLAAHIGELWSVSTGPRQRRWPCGAAREATLSALASVAKHPPRRESALAGRPSHWSAAAGGLMAWMSAAVALKS